MKYKLALLSLMTLLFGLSAQTLTQAFVVTEIATYSGIDYTNYYADSVLVDSGSVIEKTTAASDSSTSLSLAKSEGSLMYIGFDEAFDGFAMDVDTSAANGSYKVTYWNGSTWSTLKSTSSADIKNNSSSGVFKVEWDRPSGWDARTLGIDSNEDGDQDTSDSLYFVKIEVVNAYDNAATIGKMGILDYNLVINVEDELGNDLQTVSDDFDLSSSGDETVYTGKVEDTTLYFALHASGSSYTYTLNPSGYVTGEDSVSIDKGRSTETLRLDFTHKISAEDADDGSSVTLTSAKAGNDNVSCTIYKGDAYCPVDTNDDGDSATVYASGYDSESFTLPNRTSDSTSQKLSTVEMTASNNNDDNEVDLTVTDLSMDGDDLIVKVKNQGDQDVSSSDTPYLYVYVDGDKESSYSIDSDYLDGNETLNVTFTLDALDNLDENVEVEACVDPTDTVDESDEDNNCRTEDFGSNSSTDEIDFEVTEIYVDDGDLYYTVANTGDKDASGTVKVKTTAEQDGDTSTLATKSYSSSSSSNDFLDADEETTYNLGSLLDDYYDDGSDFDVTVCIDSDDDFDESSENNNCMTVDDSELDGGSSAACGNFSDVDESWAAEFICDLYDRDVVEGRTSYRFYPDASVTRAEFLKMTLLGLDYEPYAVSGVYYDDVSSHDWYYEYVTYATAQGFVDGYDDGSFKPNQSISRAEAIALVLRAADQEDYTYHSSDIDYWDVDTSDWFAWAVVVADQADIVNGYSNNSFKPEEAITRAEASKIVDLTYQDFIE